jgi:hypothetical protein
MLAASIAERAGVDARVFDVEAAFDRTATFEAGPAAAQGNPDWLIAAGAALRDVEPTGRGAGFPLTVRSLLDRIFGRNAAPSTAIA